MNDDYDLAAIRAAVSMFDLLNQLDIDHPSPRPGGVAIHALTREETEPSLHVYEDHWFDYGTGQGGDIFDFVKLVKPSWPFRRIVQWLSGEAGDVGWRPSVAPPTRKEPKDFTAQFHGTGEWFRGNWGSIPASTMTDFNVRQRGNDEILIPHFHERRVLGVKVRGHYGKLAWPGSTFKHLYRPPKIQWSAPAVLLCEGESDTWAAYSVLEEREVHPVGLPSGVNSFRPDMLETLDEYDLVLSCLDPDEAGQRATEKIAQLIDIVDLSRVMPDGAADLREAVCDYGWDLGAACQIV